MGGDFDRLFFGKGDLDIDLGNLDTGRLSKDLERDLVKDLERGRGDRERNGDRGLFRGVRLRDRL